MIAIWTEILVAKLMWNGGQKDYVKEHALSHYNELATTRKTMKDLVNKTSNSLKVYYVNSMADQQELLSSVQPWKLDNAVKYRGP